MHHQMWTGFLCLSWITAGAAEARSINATDKQFLVSAAKTDMTEAHKGEMAQNQATRSDVKDFAKTLVQDHTGAYTKLSQLATKTGVTIPNGIDTGKDAGIQTLGHLKGQAFDAQFARSEVAAYRKELAAFQSEAAHGKDADVKSFASQMVPEIQKELREAESCAKPPHKR